jgi:hypothetical protein
MMFWNDVKREIKRSYEARMYGIVWYSNVLLVLMVQISVYGMVPYNNKKYIRHLEGMTLAVDALSRR